MTASPVGAGGAVQHVLAWLIAHVRWIVTAVVVTSIGLGLAAMRLPLEFHAADLLPQGHPFIAVHNRYHRNFSEANVADGDGGGARGHDLHAARS